MVKQEFKVISFPEAKKKLQREQFWSSFLNKIKSVFKKTYGFDKYRIVQWGYYKDSQRTYVEVQNLKTGKIKLHTVGLYRSADDAIAYEAVKFFVSKLK